MAPGPGSEAERREAWRTLAAAVLTSGVVFAAFIPALSAGFVNWDDDMWLVDNPHFRGLSWSHLSWMFGGLWVGTYQPLSWVTCALDHGVWGMDPFG
ncbi:MAG: hypothetical protein WC943_17630, partial [Elusimicrobiota bacterium]